MWSLALLISYWRIRRWMLPGVGIIIISIDDGCEEFTRDFSHLCVIDLQRAAGRVDVAAVQVITSPRRRLDGVELDHRLDAVLLEDHDSQHRAVWMTNRINHFLQRRKVEINCWR